MGGRGRDPTAIKAAKPLKEPPMKGYRDKLGSSEKRKVGTGHGLSARAPPPLPRAR